MANRAGDSTKKIDEQDLNLLADIALSIVKSLQITIDEKWASVSDMTDLQHLQDLTDASKRCQTYTKDVIAAMLSAGDASIPNYLFTSSIV